MTSSLSDENSNGWTKIGESNREMDNIEGLFPTWKL